jgi:predicted RNase H-like HicB family nuclease
MQIMRPAQRLTAIIEGENDGFVALCPELDLASEGESVEDARANLIEALTRFLKRLTVRNLPSLSRRSLRDVNPGPVG